MWWRRAAVGVCNVLMCLFDGFTEREQHLKCGDESEKEKELKSK